MPYRNPVPRLTAASRSALQTPRPAEPSRPEHFPRFGGLQGGRQRASGEESVEDRAAQQVAALKIDDERARDRQGSYRPGAEGGDERRGERGTAADPSHPYEVMHHLYADRWCDRALESALAGRPRPDECLQWWPVLRM